MKNFMPERNKVKKSCTSRIILMIAFSWFVGSATFAQGDLLLYPKRIVFDGSKRSQELNLANSGKDTARYVLSVIQIRMREDGSFETITEPDPGQNFADSYFRIFPRKVVLGPNEAQTVKIQLVNSGELQPGEYRSHLYIRAEPEQKPLGEEETVKDSGNISVKIVAVFGISIPVIIRSGENTAAVNLSETSFQLPNDTLPILKFAFNRSGNMSVYGDVAVDYVSPEGKTTRVGTANGLAVYTPTAKRYFTMALSPATGIDFHKGSLHLTYRYGANKNDQVAEQNIALR